METAQAALLADGRRLHLHHGPIDLIIEVWGTERDAAYARATARFENLLQELVDELPALRSPAQPDRTFAGSVAKRMQKAVAPHAETFVTPMAAVAGAVADEILSVMVTDSHIDKAYVNNGGDVAFHLTAGHQVDAVIAAPMDGTITITADDPYRGIATSGWQGRSHSLGIADSVSVVADTAAAADVAATLIANAIDLPGNFKIERRPAKELAPDSDLGDRLVTTDVGYLTPQETDQALATGVEFAESLAARNLIAGALMMLNQQVRQVGAASAIETGKRIITHV